MKELSITTSAFLADAQPLNFGINREEASATFIETDVSEKVAGRKTETEKREEEERPQIEEGEREIQRSFSTFMIWLKTEDSSFCCA